MVTSGSREVPSVSNVSACLKATHSYCVLNIFWVAVKELKLGYYIGETLLFTIYIPSMVT